jgi:hypothetical protein
LQKINFQIESSDWKEIITNAGECIKVNKEVCPDAREYEGQQYFTHSFLVKSNTENQEKLPESWTYYQDIIEEKYAGAYQKFLEEENIQFLGRHFSGNKEMNGIGKHAVFLC